MAEDPRTHHGEVPPALCRITQESHRQGGLVPVQKHLSTGRALIPEKDKLYDQCSL